MLRAFSQHLNFFRLHLLAFSLIPLITAAIVYACNGAYPIPFVDALFLCISAATGTGLTTSDLSALTVFQQALVALLAFAGSPVLVAWTAVLTRRTFFTRHLEHIVEAELAAGALEPARFPTFTALGRTLTTFTRRAEEHVLRPRQVDPTQIRIVGASKAGTRDDATDTAPVMTDSPAPLAPITSSPALASVHFSNSPTPMSPLELPPLDAPEPTEKEKGDNLGALRRRTLNQRATTLRAAGLPVPASRPEDRGGFFRPFAVADAALARAAPNLRARVHRALTMPVNEMLSGAALPSAHELGMREKEGHDKTGRQVSYLGAGARVAVRRGSTFSLGSLSGEVYEEIGGAEYRALGILLWTVPAFYVGTLVVAFVMIAPYMSLARWDPTFLPPVQHRPINSTWYSLFEVIGAWANTGMSLVDQNLVPFQRAYLLLLVVTAVAVLGETGFPIGLRFFIWVLSHTALRHGRAHAAASFLLDHPRRCFILLFPSRQTWFLLSVLLAFNIFDWACFLILDIGIPELDAVPLGVRVLIGLVQAVGVRLAGFAAVAPSVLAPALKVLYLVMMYISAYPVAMSVRATNVYEEQSLGVFEPESDEDAIENDADYPAADGRVAIWGRYLGRHVRHQLSYDLWWLMFAIFVLAISERGNLRNADNDSWFNLFSLMFETTSAYTTVGLSLGIPTANYSLCGSFSTFSKLVLCGVMLRGRHRGLPVKIDRAILLPREFQVRAQEQARKLRAELAARARRERASQYE